MRIKFLISMNYKFTAIGLLIIFCFLSMQSIAQKSIIVQLRNGSESYVQLEQLQKITLGASMLELRNPSEILQSFKIEEIQKIRFGVYSSITSPTSEFNLQVFPNPVTDFFTIRNAPKETYKATIHSIDGRIIKEISNIGENQEINVAELQTGIYLLRVNKSIIKFSKL